MKRRVKPPTTGRYQTRAELVEAVRALYAGPQNLTQIAKACRVSPTTVANILKTGK